MNEPNDNNRLTALENRMARFEEHVYDRNQIKSLVCDTIVELFRALNQEIAEESCSHE